MVSSTISLDFGMPGKHSLRKQLEDLSLGLPSPGKKLEEGEKAEEQEKAEEKQTETATAKEKNKEQEKEEEKPEEKA